MRAALSTNTDGSFLPLEPQSVTLLHREQATSGTRYLRVSGFNIGKRARKITFLFNDVDSVYATVQPTGVPQILVPDLPLYNSGSGIDIYASLKQSVSSWTFPENLNDLVLLQDGSVAGIILANVTATNDAQPILIHIEDSRRTDGDVDPQKGSEAILELYQVNGSIGVDIIFSGYNLLSDSLQASVSSGVYLFGDIFSD